MDNYACEKTSAVRRQEKENDENEARMSLSGRLYIHNQRSIKTIYIFVVIKTDLSQQQHLKWIR